MAKSKGLATIHYNSLFQQLFNFIPRHRFEKSIKNLSGAKQPFRWKPSAAPRQDCPAQFLRPGIRFPDRLGDNVRKIALHFPWSVFLSFDYGLVTIIDQKTGLFQESSPKMCASPLGWTTFIKRLV